ncbi:MAG: deoxyribodipyrimidine photo-lyase [Anaerolineaceae bacterium]|jgi:deoxyribodipyrimidine photo-lyase|nr:deoxyribodipyrimidine photo-lyase [Anaerolineaceae bacterium]
MKPVIWWIRRDLRINDNAALRAALETGAPVLPVFILDPVLLNSHSRNGGACVAHPRQSFLFDGLRRLRTELESRGSALVVRHGQPLAVLQALIQESQASTIFAEEDYSPYARRRDAAIAAALPLELVMGVTIQHPAVIHKADGSPYTVFTPFSRAWKKLPLPGLHIWQAPQRLPAPPALDSVPIPQADPVPGFPAGEREAQRRLDSFISEGINGYANGRNQLALHGTSVLSPYLRFGMLSAHQAWAAACKALAQAETPEARRGIETWINELIWREFYNAILYHFPDVLKHAFRPAMRNIVWRNAPDDLHAWQSGHTGYPVVDAAMRQLLHTGWMHNRGRMIAASFLVKDLLIHWQAGERWFMQRLVDGDPAANNGGWQWTAGVGTDAAPYFRIFNPTLQSKKFDPQGAYIRRWVPELAQVPDKFIHEPWLMPQDAQQASGCQIGKDYPLPIVDHPQARQRTLDAYKRAKASYDKQQENL